MKIIVKSWLSFLFFFFCRFFVSYSCSQYPIVHREQVLRKEFIIGVVHREHVDEKTTAIFLRREDTGRDRESMRPMVASSCRRNRCVDSSRLAIDGLVAREVINGSRSTVSEKPGNRETSHTARRSVSCACLCASISSRNAFATVTRRWIKKKLEFETYKTRSDRSTIRPSLATTYVSIDDKRIRVTSLKDRLTKPMRSSAWSPVCHSGAESETSNRSNGTILFFLLIFFFFLFSKGMTLSRLFHFRTFGKYSKKCFEFPCPPVVTPLIHRILHGETSTTNR